MTPDTRPVLLLAFANDRHGTHARYLMLPEERRQLEDVLAPARWAGVEVIVEANATPRRLFDLLGAYNDRLVGVHFGGHATGDALTLEDRAGRPQLLHHDGLARRIGALPHLRWVCLNACGTAPHIEAIHACSPVPVIATSTAILDDAAVTFARRLYHGLAHRATIGQAFTQAESELRGEAASPDGLCRDGQVADRAFTRMLRPAAGASERWPWVLAVPDGYAGRLDATLYDPLPIAEAAPPPPSRRSPLILVAVALATALASWLVMRSIDSDAPAAPDAEAPDAEAPAIPDAEAPAIPDAEAPAIPDAEAPAQPDPGPSGLRLRSGIPGFSRPPPSFVTAPARTFTSSQTGQPVSHASFHIASKELTQREWTAAMGTAPFANRGCADCAAERVNWYEALALANTLSDTAGHDRCYDLADCGPGRPGGGCAPGAAACAGEPWTCRIVRDRTPTCLGFRLPTAIEAESVLFAGLAPLRSRGPWVDSLRVGTGWANSWGLYGGASGVFEWSFDIYGGAGPRGSTTGWPTDAPLRFPALRGGAVRSVGRDRRSVRTIAATAESRRPDLGIRLVMNARADPDRAPLPDLHGPALELTTD